MQTGDRADHHHYILTEKGKDLGVVLVALWQWSEKHSFADSPVRTLVDRSTGEAIAPLALSTVSGASLEPSGYTTVPGA